MVGGGQGGKKVQVGTGWSLMGAWVFGTWLGVGEGSGVEGGCGVGGQAISAVEIMGEWDWKGEGLRSQLWSCEHGDCMTVWQTFIF